MKIFLLSSIGMMTCFLEVVVLPATSTNLNSTGGATSKLFHHNTIREFNLEN